MDYTIRKPNRTHRKNTKRISKDFKPFEYLDSSKKTQRRMKIKYARAAKQKEKEFLEKEIEGVLYK